jgi:hypothetical protein
VVHEEASGTKYVPKINGAVGNKRPSWKLEKYLKEEEFDEELYEEAKSN